MGKVKDTTYVPCSLGVGCEETGVCYALAHNKPEHCGKPNSKEK